MVGTLVEEIRGVDEWVKGNLDEATRQAVERQGYGAQFISPEVVEAQQKIADTFTELKLIPKQLTIKDVIWNPPAKVAQAQ